MWGAAPVPRSCARLLQVDFGVSLQWIVCSVNIGYIGSGFNHFHHVSEVVSSESPLLLRIISFA